MILSRAGRGHPGSIYTGLKVSTDGLAWWKQGLWGCRRFPSLSADSLENVSGEPEATPGLQQLAGIVAVQPQVVNGADDLSVHVPDHARNTPSVEREREPGIGGGWKEEGVEKKGREGGVRG